jgi:hypothetical protein
MRLTRSGSISWCAGGYLRGRGALDTEDLLYLREMEDAEQDAERARIQAERRAFAQFRAAAAAKTEVAPLPVLGQPKERGKPNARWAPGSFSINRDTWII